MHGFIRRTACPTLLVTLAALVASDCGPAIDEPAAATGATVDWVARAATPLATTDPTASLDDLEPLRQMIGTAHVVGVGAGTRGTREFFLMTHRILELLVTRMAFTHVAIEATSTETDDLNRFVLTGVGDPTRLLSRLYAWPWNTQETLDVVRWMRQWNASASPERRVQLLGVDIQFPGAAMDTVDAFVGRVDTRRFGFVPDRYACLDAFRNVGELLGRSAALYQAQPAATRAACATGVREVHDLIATSRAAYAAVTTPAEYERALHAARLVEQFEAHEAVVGDAGESGVRDAFLAENVAWIRDRAGADARIVLWAHNRHVDAAPARAGAVLRAAYGTDYVALGFAFGRGDFNAVSSLGLRSYYAGLLPDFTLEPVLLQTGMPRLLLDMRRIPTGGAAAAPLQSISMRSIDERYDPALELNTYQLHRFPSDFDLIVFLAATTASRRLPFAF